MTNAFIFAVFVSLAFLFSAQPKQKTIFEPGVFIVGLFSLCYLLPVIGVKFNPDSFPTDYLKNSETISMYGLLFVAVFSISYVAFKKSQWASLLKLNLGIQCRKWEYLIYFLTLFLGTKIIYSYYGVGQADEYLLQYLIKAEMPSNISQIIQVLKSAQWLIICLLLASSLENIKCKYSLFVVGIIFAIFGIDALVTKSRSNFVTLCFTSLAAYNLYNKAFGIKKELFFATLFMLVIHNFAFLREDPDSLNQITILDVLIPSEFLIIYNNAEHLASLAETNQLLATPTNSYLEALIAFVPKQLNKDKWDLASWYVTTYFPGYAAAGGGLAFGIIPEAIVTWGLLSIVLQAFVLSAIFGVFYSVAYASRFKKGNIFIIFYLFIFSSTYSTIRSNSFSIISGLFLGFVIPFLLLFFLSKIDFFKRFKDV